MMRYILILTISGLLLQCSKPSSPANEVVATTVESPSKIAPKYVTPALPNDSDDPAIWYNEDNPSESLIVGTDKNELNGGLYAFDIHGSMEGHPNVYPMDRPNNVDLIQGLSLGDSTVDVAVVAERMTASIRVYTLPDLLPVDNGGIKVFEDDTANAVMGIALYHRHVDNEVFAIVSRKSNPVDEDDYLYQYRLDGSSGVVRGELVRKFGKFSGEAEIEAIAVDAEHGYVYYSDEMYGIRKYYADPDSSNVELAVFGTTGFTDDREGISIYKHEDGSGYILVSNQGGNTFNVYPREGSGNDPHAHPQIASLVLSTVSSDGSEVSSRPFGPEFPQGLFVAMSDNRTFEIYDWRDLQEEIDKQTNSEQ